MLPNRCDAIFRPFADFRPRVTLDDPVARIECNAAGNHHLAATLSKVDPDLLVVARLIHSTVDPSGTVECGLA